MSDQKTIPGFSVKSSIPGVRGGMNSIEACINDLDRDGHLYDEDDETKTIAGHCISINVNGLGAFTAVQARVVAARLTELANTMEAGR